MQRLLSDQSLDRLEEAVHVILQRAGMKVCNEEILRRLADRGADVDLGDQVARFPESMIAEVIDMQRATQEPPPTEAGRLPAGTVEAVGLGYDIAPRIYDFRERRPRRATRQDLLDLVDLGDALPQVVSVGCPVIMGDVSPRTEAIEAFAELVCRTNKPPSVISIEAAHNPYFAEIGEIVLGPSDQPRFVGGGGFVITPLTVNPRLAALMLEGEKYRLKSAGAATMAISGLSAPATIAGTIALAAADCLGGWIVIRAANPHCEVFSAGTASGTLDMRTTKGCFGTPEAALQDVGVVELFEGRLGGHAGISGSGYIDATTPGLQAVYEKATKAYIFSRCRGYRLRLGNAGLIDAGALYSPTQYVLELELNAGFARADWEVPVDDEHLALDDILAVGPGQKRNFLTTDHTLRHCRDAWAPRLLDKGARELADARDEEQLLQRADRYWRDVLASHTPPEIDENRRRAVWAVVERARRELIGGK